MIDFWLAAGLLLLVALSFLLIPVCVAVAPSVKRIAPP
jgi:hypothetical protein